MAPGVATDTPIERSDDEPARRRCTAVIGTKTTSSGLAKPPPPLGWVTPITWNGIASIWMVVPTAPWGVRPRSAAAVAPRTATRRPAPTSSADRKLPAARS